MYRKNLSIIIFSEDFRVFRIRVCLVYTENIFLIYTFRGGLNVGGLEVDRDIETKITRISGESSTLV